MMPHYDDQGVTLFHGDNRDVLHADENGYRYSLGYGTRHLIRDNSIDSVVTDPPYELGFMGKGWDSSGIAYDVDLWRECFRVLKPGGHLLAFGGTRTFHRMAVAVEDAGFELRDSIAWLYGSGFPKSLDVSKAIDKAAGATREVTGTRRAGAALTHGGANARPWHERQAARGGEYDVTAAASDAAKVWEGWGTALKPAFEPIVVARKPLVGTVAQNVLEHGTGALNIDANRIEASGRPLIVSKSEASVATFGDGLNGSSYAGVTDTGRWPTNVLLDASQAAALDAQTGVSTSRIGKPSERKGGAATDFAMTLGGTTSYADSGGASRFFPTFEFTADDLAWEARVRDLPTFRYEAKAPGTERPAVDGVQHATVKPLDLMRWLVRLVTPPGGTVLEPFAGSGTTIEACLREGFQCIAVEIEAAHLPLIMQRIRKPQQQSLFGDWEEN